MNLIYKEIYKTDSKGKTRVWFAEQNDDKYRMHDGVLGGKIKCSEWKLAEPTNVGRANERNGVEQASFEIEALYTKKLERDYHEELSSSPMKSKILEAMRAHKTTISDVVFPSFVQPKLDGIRCIVTREGMWSRSGKPIVSCPHILEECLLILEEFPTIEFLDGELYNHDFKDDFNTIQSLVMKKSADTLDEETLEKIRSKVQYHIYDCGYGEAGFNIRNDFVSNIFESIRDDIPSIRRVNTVFVRDLESLEQTHSDNLAEGYEGSMVRIPLSKYEHKRSKSLLKLKEFEDEEFEVVSLDEGKGNWSGTIKSVTCKNKNGQVFSAGIKGNRAFTDTLWNRIDNPPKTVTVRYQNLTPDGIPRFPVAVAFYDSTRDY